MRTNLIINQRIVNSFPCTTQLRWTYLAFGGGMDKKVTEDRLYEDIRYEISDLKTAYLVGSYTATKDKPVCEEHLDELASLSKTYGFIVIGRIACPLKKIDPGTYIGKGKVEEIAKIREDLGADVVIFDDNLSPNQERNLEKSLSIRLSIVPN